VDWTPATPSEGFVVSHAIISDQAGHTLLDVPDIAVPPADSLPTVELYADMVGKAAEAADLLNQGPITEAKAQRIRDDIQKALDVILAMLERCSLRPRSTNSLRTTPRLRNSAHP